MPPPPVPARRGGVYVYDPIRDAVVTFGGSNNVQHLGATWVDNRELTFGPGQEVPAGRSHAASTFDVRRGEVLVFGGITSAGPVGETWTFDGERWRDVTPGRGQPPVRRQHAMAYDNALREVLMFGGRSSMGSEVFDDTWSWNGSRWRQLEPFFAPLARHSLAMSSSPGGVVMLGGRDTQNVNNSLNNWNGENWVPGGQAAGPPDARSGHALIHDSVNGGLFLFGGELNDGTYDGRTWDLAPSGLSWRARSLPGPTARIDHAMAFDAARGRTVLFGGFRAQPRATFGDLWEWDGAVWTQINSNLPGPSPRSAHSMTYDPIRGRVVLFGGKDSQDLNLSDAWEWDGTQWSLLSVTLDPGARSQHQMTYDLNRSRAVLFGGLGSGDMTWELDCDVNQRPGMQTSFDLAELTSRQLLFDGVDVIVAAGGDGSSLIVPGVGTRVPGFEVGLWAVWHGRWFWLGADSATSTAPSTATMSTSVNAEEFIAQDQMMYAIVRSISGWGNGIDPGQIAVDGLELRVRYRHSN